MPKVGGGIDLRRVCGNKIFTLSRPRIDAGAWLSWMQRHLVFVYGTLKRGGSNHGRLSGQTYVGNARTDQGATLYSLGNWQDGRGGAGGYPGLVYSPMDTSGVTGELWYVDNTTLKCLDELEGVVEGLYIRENAVLVEWPESLSATEAAKAQLYRYLRPVVSATHLGSYWKV